ncbi:MAG: hypothetical protein PSN36_00030 [Gammaproteobacteria bacterium]|nr:hypothetical protein [Gammaproteobacteria bacterium]
MCEKEITQYHQLAKDAGNKLKSYIFSLSSGATGVFFFLLIKNEGNFKSILSIALLFFVFTIALCLYELRVDAQRFFLLARELEKEEKQQQWETNEKLKKRRLRLMNVSYITFSIAIIFSCTYLIFNIVK